ncbi:Zn-dependent protease (includes SpoIVFB) [Desulfonatronum thiosulfatophilum]|uniref:Zinc metalloprotease n=1 Tax=Desulfonatronum thiosulfatophilum TaxID=617002 RepID=A0A1G6DK31_9BACT|nr:site-2 protease family protein [Desulfonatronum thiosulfatophilum]SDB45476.1 Zn-dependent protease (includes SpoIVFB) [Desulfonatronum thiosulfatophilum]
MFGKSIKLFKVFGFQFKVDPSWIIIAALVTWSLAVGFFPHVIEGLQPLDYWKLAIVGALGLFFSILFHEFWHSMVARRFGVEVSGITLFIFGGVAEMPQEPKTPKSEFWIAIAGPAASLFLALVFYLIYDFGFRFGMDEAVSSVFMYVALINLILAIFNLIPAFPMDGGRILRSALWSIKKDQRWATKISTNFGMVFGLVLIGLGLLNILTGNIVGGLWYSLIGMFIRYAARNSYQQLAVKHALAGEQVRTLMKPPVTIPSSISLQEMVEDYVYRYHHKFFPVQDGKDRVEGCITTKQVGELGKEEWPRTQVREIMIPCSVSNSVGPDEDVADVLRTMNATGLSRMMVMENERLLGIISLKDILGYLTARMELQGDRGLE